MKTIHIKIFKNITLHSKSKKILYTFIVTEYIKMNKIMCLLWLSKFSYHPKNINLYIYKLLNQKLWINIIEIEWNRNK